MTRLYNNRQPILQSILLLLLLLTQSTLAQVELCRNSDWLDEDGCGCDEYEFNPEWCALYGAFVYEGESADSACCACGGGTQITFTDDSIRETDPPILIGQKNCILSPPIKVAPGLTVENWVDNDTLTFRMRLVYEGKSWLGLSFENDGRPGKPLFAVIGQMEEDASDNFGSVEKYFLNSAKPDASGVVVMPSSSQTLEDTSFVQTDTKTIMEFTKPMNEIFDNPQQIVTDRVTWIYAVGLPNNQWQGTHTMHGKFNLALKPCFTNPWEIANPSVNGGVVDINNKAGLSFKIEKPNQFLWITHGLTLVIAWGIVAPIALATTFLKRKGPRWAKVNQFCNTTTLLMTCAGILLGVIATFLEEEASHLSSDHSYYGVGVFGGLLLYCMLALSLGAVSAQKEKQRAKQTRRKAPARSVATGTWDEDGNFNAQDSAPPEKPGMFEWLSRLILLGTIGVAYYTCQTGLDWQWFHWDLDWEYYYWGVGAVGAALLLLLVGLSCCIQDSNSTSIAAQAAQSKTASLGGQDSMVGWTVEQKQPALENPYEYNPYQPYIPKPVEEENFYYPPQDNSIVAGSYPQDNSIVAANSSYGASKTRNTNQGTLKNQQQQHQQLEYLAEEDGENAQRSPIRSSWDMDCCAL